MASRAFRHRLRIACSICAGSTWTGSAWAGQHTVSSTPGPATGSASCALDRTMSLTSTCSPGAVVGTAEGGQPTGEVRRAAQGVAGRPRLVAHHTRVAGHLRHQVEAGAGDQQRVVEIVDEADRQAAGERQLLGVAQLGIDVRVGDAIALRARRATGPWPGDRGEAVEPRRETRLPVDRRHTECVDAGVSQRAGIVHQRRR